MAIGPPKGHNPWQESISSVVTDEPQLYYRVWGGRSARLGRWLTPTRPATRAEATAGLALPPGNEATMVTEVWVPAGVRIQVGKAAPQFGRPGGWDQVELLQAIPMSCFGHDQALP